MKKKPVANKVTKKPVEDSIAIDKSDALSFYDYLDRLDNHVNNLESIKHLLDATLEGAFSTTEPRTMSLMELTEKLVKNAYQEVDALSIDLFAFGAKIRSKL
jgi:exonuclease VII small subunit